MGTATFVLSSQAATRGVPLLFGFPAYGGGPFESRELPTTVPLLIGFLLICALEGLAGWWLCSSQRRGAVLALVLVPFGAVFWWGFALPLPPLFGPSGRSDPSQLASVAAHVAQP